MNRINRARLLGATALMGSALAFISLAHAQFVWIDEKGVKQFSDRGPPSSIPQKNILKAPGMSTAAMLVAQKPADSAPVPSDSASKPLTMAERNADFRKRAKEKEEREQKESAADASKAAKAENCDRARSYKQSMDSGVRVSTTDKNGERSFMSDEQRTAESKKADKAISSCN
jgi:hypothetical protein